ncbi:hypothetical protein [Paraburkholderia aromaticivorans]|uniref:hypothetical protein n=1 Tax=Paraburkholderia aromaticivorans TaxID=2026199 RepID=UPI001456138E|nr:hypothetical protein [Paraburkholderia aromaticivorans]
MTNSSRHSRSVPFARDREDYAATVRVFSANRFRTMRFPRLSRASGHIERSNLSTTGIRKIFFVGASAADDGTKKNRFQEPT